MAVYGINSWTKARRKGTDTHQHNPPLEIHPTPSNVLGFNAHHWVPVWTQAIVPSKLTQVSPDAQNTSAGHASSTQRKPTGHDGSCDSARRNKVEVLSTTIPRLLLKTAGGVVKFVWFGGNSCRDLSQRRGLASHNRDKHRVKTMAIWGADLSHDRKAMSGRTVSMMWRLLPGLET